MKLIKEFKAFISRGNVLDMAIGIVIGSAFTAIVNSLVKDIINPVIGYLTSGINLTGFKFILREAIMGSDGKIVTEELAISYGLLLNAIINFLLVALVLFFIIKGFNKLKAKELARQEAEAKAKQEAEANKPTELSVLTAILEELKAQK